MTVLLMFMFKILLCRLHGDVEHSSVLLLTVALYCLQFSYVLFTVQFMYCDLASFKSIKTFASKYKERGLPLHILVNNGKFKEAYCYKQYSSFLEYKIRENYGLASVNKVIVCL